MGSNDRSASFTDTDSGEGVGGLTVSDISFGIRGVAMIYAWDGNGNGGSVWQWPSSFICMGWLA